MGANAISRSQTQHDPLRMSVQVKGSPFDSVRRWQTPEMGLDFPDTEEVTGSNPVRSTRFFEILRDCESRNESQPPAVLRSFRTTQVRPSLLRPTEDPHRRFGGPARSAPSWWLSSDLVSLTTSSCPADGTFRYWNPFTRPLCVARASAVIVFARHRDSAARAGSGSSALGGKRAWTARSYQTMQ